MVSGAGLYRNVRLVTTERVHVPVWGTQLTTPHVSAEYASVRLRTTIRNAGDADVRISTDIIAPDGKIVARKDNSRKINHGQPFEQNFLINAPSLWSPETPYLYKAVSKIYVDGKQTDEYTTRFGIRSIEIIADKGFFLMVSTVNSRGYAITTIWARWVRLSMWLLFAVS